MTFSSAEDAEELDHPTQPVEVEHMRDLDRRDRCRRLSRWLGRIKGDGRVTAVGQPDDDIRVLTMADADDK